ncbi:MAG: MFS transporter [Dehalococcoidia bacterium]
MNRLPAFPTYLGLSFASATAYQLSATINLVFQNEVAGLNPLQLVLVGSVLELTVLLGEAPTGVLADLVSRRLSIVLGLALVGVGLAIQAVPFFPVILLAQVIWGLGYTFTSGATEAWLVDEVGMAHATGALLRGGQAAAAGALVGAPTAAALAMFSLQLPLLAAGAIMLALVGVLALVMPERGFPRSGLHREGGSAFRAGLVAGITVVRTRPGLGFLLISFLLAGAASEGFDRLWVTHLLVVGLPPLGPLPPVAWWGAIEMAAILGGLVALEAVRRFSLAGERTGTAVMLAIQAAIVVAIAFFALSGNFALAVVAYLPLRALRRLLGPVQTAWLAPRLPAEVRATGFSIFGQADAAGQIAGGPLLGVFGLVATVRAALVGSAVLLAMALPLYPLAGRGDAEPVRLSRP